MLQPRLRVADHKKARDLGKSFKELEGLDAWAKLRRFVQVQILLAGQDALANPEIAQRKADWASGASFILDVVRGTIDQVEVIDDESEPDDTEEDFLELMKVGGADL
jgi:hypothetical protein